MDNNVMMGYYISLALLLILAGVMIAMLFYKKKHSEITKKTATKAFKRSGVLKGFKSLCDVDFGDGVVADQVIVGPFGVILACDLHQNGKIYGDLEGKEWIVAVGEDGKATKTRIASPLHMVRQCEKELRKKLAIAKIYSVPIETMVVKTQKQACYITASAGHMYSIKEVKEQLARVKYEKNNNVNVDVIIELLAK